MKKKHIILSAMLAAIVSLTSSCSNFLDELPDNRTDLNTEQSIAKLLVSAYPITSFAMIGEMTSDNTDNNGGARHKDGYWKGRMEHINNRPYAKQ